jgi:hypothetical protein
MSEAIDISNLNKAQVLASLYNNSQPLGLGFLQATSGDMTTDEAQAHIDKGDLYFDYLNGRVMKVDLEGDSLETWLYDRDNGEGAASRAIASL